MKTAITSLFLTGAILLNCNIQAQSNDNRIVSSFTSIETSVPLDVTLEKGSKENVNISVTGVDPQKILTEVKGNTLKVFMEKGSYSNLKGKITITYVSLSGIASSGSGDLTCKSDVDAGNFALSSSGSGDIKVEGKIKTSNFSFQHKGSGDVFLASLETTDLAVSMMGSGDFKAVSGTAQKQTIDLMGSGDVQIAGLSGESCTVAIKGSGDVETNVSNVLQGSILGSGNVQYKGDPKKQIEVRGSGSVSKL